MFQITHFCAVTAIGDKHPTGQSGAMGNHTDSTAKIPRENKHQIL